MDQDILTIRARLEKLTDTLKRNRENVPLDVLKTKYKKGYDALSKYLSRTASGYILLKVLHDIQINKDYQEPEVVHDFNAGLAKRLATDFLLVGSGCVYARPHIHQAGNTNQNGAGEDNDDTSSDILLDECE